LKRMAEPLRIVDPDVSMMVRAHVCDQCTSRSQCGEPRPSCGKHNGSDCSGNRDQTDQSDRPAIR
jgi:hypothetical protein